MLWLDRLVCGYGAMRAVHGLNLAVETGEMVALVGANGAGKTTTIMAVAGHVAIEAGHIRHDGEDIVDLSPMARVARGIALAPEGRRLFRDLSVRENLIVGGYARAAAETRRKIDRVVSLFPRLGERLSQPAGALSGGEQQMAAIGRALMAEPRLLMIDELSLGLMPKMIDACYEALAALKRDGLTILLVEQSTPRALAVADRVVVMQSGRAVWEGTAAEARGASAIIDAYLGLAGAPG
ncbi:MAG: ABC transporter ATP-binding protein [Alphaproteobacteria bacterium]